MIFPTRCALFAVLAAFSGIAAAQTLQCSTNAANSANLRSTGEAEETGDLILTCSGGTPTPNGQTVPGVNFTLAAGVAITSRLLAPNWSEALLLVDEPAAAIQLPCSTANGVCLTQGTAGSGTYDGTNGHPNVFQAQQNAPTSLNFINIPFDPPGAGKIHIFRFTNLRVNAFGVSPGSPVSLFISASGGVPINNAQATVGTAQVPVTISSRNVQTGANGIAQFTISLLETFTSALKTRTSTTSSETSPSPVSQNNPNQFLPGTETGFFNSQFPAISGRGNLGLAGLADNGTRMMVVLSGIPAGVTLITAPNVGLTPGTGILRLISTDSNGVGGYQASNSGILIPDSNGTVIAVFEVLTADPQAIERASLPFTVSYSGGAPRLDTISASAGLAPVNKVSAADLTAPLPRFNSLSSLQISSLGITPTSIPQGALGVPYTALFSPTGGTGPYVWSATGLPQGLTMSASGIINGVPATTGQFTVVVTVTDFTQSSTSLQLPLLIGSGLVIVTASLPNGTVGFGYSSPVLATGGTGTVTFFIAAGTISQQSTVPPGLTLSPGGVLQGIPLTAGTYAFTVQAQDQANHQAVQRYTVTIAPPLSIPTTTVPSASAGGGQITFQFTVQGGTAPYVFSLIGNAPPGLSLTSGGLLNGNPTAAGTFPFSVKVTDGQGVSVTKQFQITITPAPSLLQVSSTQLNFIAPFQGEAPSPQILAITSASTLPVNFLVTLDSGTTGSSAPRWLSVSPVQGVSPAALQVVVDQSSLVIGIADARIRITIPGDATRVPVDIAVHLDIAGAPPQLVVTPTFVRVRAKSAAPGIQKLTVLIRNTGGGPSINFTTAVLKRSSWITNVSLPGGQTSINRAVAVVVTINSQGLKAGVYRDTLRVVSSATVVDVPITLFVAEPGPYLGVDTRGLRFQARQGAGSSFTQTVRVLNLGDPGTTVNWSADLLSGSDWLFLSAARGVATPGQPGALVLSPGPNAANLNAGPHYALVRITDSQSLASPQYVVAVLDIAVPTAPPQPELSIGLQYYSAFQGSTQPQGGTIRVYTSSVTPANFQVGASTLDGNNWLQATPSSASATTGTPGQITVLVNPTNLQPGIYKGLITVAMSGALRTKDITLVVVPPGSAQLESARAEQVGREANCGPSRLAMTLGNLTTSFDLPAQLPALISVQLTDNCNAPVVGASVVASFSNGDPPLTLGGDGSTNIYTESWQPSAATGTMTVTVRANAEPYAEASLQLTGAVEPGSAPMLNRGGTVNNLNPELDGPLAPGTVVQIFGQHLAPVTQAPGVIPLLTTINGSFVLVGGLQLPLYYVSDAQINAELPAEVPVNRPQAVIVGSGGGYSLPDNIIFTAVSPGVASQFGILIAQHSDFTLVDAVRPAKPGEVLIMYLVGMGATNPPITTGEVAVGPLKQAVVQPTVSVGGLPAAVSFAGLTPGGIGLYQINFQVPPNAVTGSLDVVVTQGDTTANNTVLLVVK